MHYYRGYILKSQHFFSNFLEKFNFIENAIKIVLLWRFPCRFCIYGKAPAALQKPHVFYLITLKVLSPSGDLDSSIPSTPAGLSWDGGESAGRRRKVTA